MSSVNPASMSGVMSWSAAPVRPSDDPGKIRDAAQQFEAILIGQILHSAREGDGGWLGSGGDSSSGCAGDFAEQQLAASLAQQGGLGLSTLITAGLRQQR